MTGAGRMQKREVWELLGICGLMLAAPFFRLGLLVIFQAVGLP
jgi:hypothetical protein